ncbi:MAG: tetratricopeptide repeat protein [Spirochaetaceae bacterium]|jgi:tetratricopeptide (TPR) repeat protein|nr:tetratricopeptide repeat protein [Spirochaetaceae bacterium]
MIGRLGAEARPKPGISTFPLPKPLFVFALILWALPLTGNLPGLYAQNRAAANPALLFERGRVFMAAEDWYSASEAFLECLRLSPAHAEASASLAECYYELGEFDQALSWVRKARALARTNMDLANLEAFTLIALGQMDNAAVIIADVLSREPYNKDALFAAAELDVSRGRAGDALIRFREVARRYPDDRRVLISLALVLGSLGDMAAATSCIERALENHGGDYRVYYYAAYLDAQAGRFPQAIRYAEQALFYRPGYAPARSLLASLRYRSGQFEEAARLADEIITLSRNDIGAWYLKGLSYIRLGRRNEALSVLSTALTIDPEDEFVRTALEDLLVSDTALEDPSRARWASWHFNQARDYRSRNLTDQALFEYRRGLRLNPYATDRREYAELLRLRGFPGRQLEELRFMQNLGLADRSINDAVEAWDSLLADTLARRWAVNPVETARRHWNIAVYSVASQSAFFHADAGTMAASYIRDLLVHDRNIGAANPELRRSSFSEAFRSAREAGVDYFLLVSVSESERDLSIKGELFVGRTGSPAGVFYAYRTGADRLRNASRGILEALGASLPFRGALLARRAAQGLIDKGRADGVEPDTVYEVVKQGRPGILNEGIGLVYTPEDVVGTLLIGEAGEELSSGTLTRNGFFDRISPGDEIILQKQKTETAAGSEAAANPELRTLLRTLR